MQGLGPAALPGLGPGAGAGRGLHQTLLLQQLLLLPPQVLLLDQLPPGLLLLLTDAILLRFTPGTEGEHKSRVARTPRMITVKTTNYDNDVSARRARH